MGEKEDKDVSRISGWIARETVMTFTEKWSPGGGAGLWCHQVDTENSWISDAQSLWWRLGWRQSSESCQPWGGWWSHESEEMAQVGDAVWEEIKAKVKVLGSTRQRKSQQETEKRVVFSQWHGDYQEKLESLKPREKRTSRRESCKIGVWKDLFDRSGVWEGSLFCLQGAGELEGWRLEAGGRSLIAVSWHISERSLEM